MVRHLLAGFERHFGWRRITHRLADRRFWRASGLLLLANAVVTALGLVRTPLMTWVLPKAELGAIGVVGAWVPFLQLLSLSGIDSAAYHYVAKGQPSAFVVGLVYRLRGSLLSAAAFFLVAGYWFWQGNLTLGWIFVIAGLTYPFTYGMTAAAGMLGAQEKFTGLFWYRIWESLTDFAGFIPLALSAWWISRAVTFYAGNQIATAIMQAGVSFWLAWQLSRAGTPRLPPQDERELVRYGRHLTALSGISVLQARTDALLVGMFLPLETVADYTIALLVFEQVRRLWGIYVAVRYPPLVRLPAAQRRKRFVREGSLVWLAFIGMGILIALAAHLLIPVILPPSYASSLGYMDLLIATVLAGMPGGLAEMYFRTQQDEKRQYRMRITAALVGVAAPLGLIFVWGAYGAAAGRLLANVVLSITGIWLFRREGQGEA